MRRTANTPKRFAIKEPPPGGPWPAQGRPLGFLHWWLAQGHRCCEKAAHRNAMVRAQATQPRRLTQRLALLDSADGVAIAAYERHQWPGEGLEPVKLP